MNLACVLVLINNPSLLHNTTVIQILTIFLGELDSSDSLTFTVDCRWSYFSQGNLLYLFLHLHTYEKPSGATNNPIPQNLKKSLISQQLAKTPHVANRQTYLKVATVIRVLQIRSNTVWSTQISKQLSSLSAI